MKRYLLFTFDDYYPSGGWQDYRGSFDSAGEAYLAGKKDDHQNLSIVDTEMESEIELASLVAKEK